MNLGKDYINRDVGIVAKNDVTTIQTMHLSSWGNGQELVLHFVCYDESQETAKNLYSCFAHQTFFCLMQTRVLSLSRSIRWYDQATASLLHEDLRAALNAVIAEQSVNSESRTSIGRTLSGNLKWTVITVATISEQW